MSTITERYILFYANLIYDKMETLRGLDSFPDGLIIYDSRPFWGVLDTQWHNKDLTPILLEDVPAELKLQVLLLGV